MLNNVNDEFNHNVGNINIAFVANVIGHGKVYDQWGTSFALLLSQVPYLEQIDIICPFGNENHGEIKMPQKINLVPCYNPERTLSMYGIIKAIKGKKFDYVIFNFGPTVFGRRNLSNFTGFFLPYISSKILKRKTVLISQGSVFTNDSENLGYNSALDRIKKRIVRMLESWLYKRVCVYTQLEYYLDLLKKIKNALVCGVVKSDYIDGVATLYLNNLMQLPIFKKRVVNKVPRILLHGYWGPQKNLGLALNSLRSLQNAGYHFSLTISGGINTHFPGYYEEYKKLLAKYSDVISERKGYVQESDLFDLFISSDLILMPYNVPGGQSGILEMAKLFKRRVICIDFPEFREEAHGNNSIILCPKEKFEEQIENFLKGFLPQEEDIDMSIMVETAIKNAAEFIASLK